MTEDDWAICESPLPMLIFLRGHVSEEEKQPPVRHSNYGELWWGPGTAITAEQCRLFILNCSRRLYEIELDVPSRNALDAYRRYVLEDAPWEEFGDACQRIHEVLVAGGETIVSHMFAAWGDNPFGAASAASDIAGAIAYDRAKDSVAITCANATEDDWFSYGFSGGPPDKLFQSTFRAEEKFQAQVLREIIGNPFQSGA